MVFEKLGSGYKSIQRYATNTKLYTFYPIRNDTALLIKVRVRYANIFSCTHSVFSISNNVIVLLQILDNAQFGGFIYIGFGGDKGKTSYVCDCKRF